MKKIIAVITGLLMMGTFLAGCGGPALPEADAGEPAKPVTTVDPAAVTAVNSMGIDMLQRLYPEMDHGNFMISPGSISMALSMTMNGAEGETLDGMRQALHIAGMDMDTVNQAQKDLMTILLNPDASEKVQVEIANALWARQGLELKDAFQTAAKDFYSAQTQFLDFGDPGSVDIINDWVDARTHGMIPTIIDEPIDADTVLYLMNTLFFDGKWTEPFDPQKTYEAVFTKGDGTAVPARMMSGEQDVTVYTGGDADCFGKSFGDSGRLQMLFIRPHGDIGDYIAGFSAEALAEIAAGMDSQKIQIGVPRFSYDTALSLKEVLAAMGMEKAFGCAAEFGPMSDAPLYIEDVLHKTRIEVKEEGAKAAAVTGVEMRLNGMPMSMILDSPFLYLIRDTQTGAVLFMGVVENPAEE